MDPRQEVDQLPLAARHRAVMPAWLSTYYAEPLELVSGSGLRVMGSDGREYLDFFGGLLATMVGHDVPEIVEAVRQQSHRILHSSTLYLISEQVRLAERIAALSGLEDPRVFFVNSGSEAVDTAFLLATTRAKSNQVLALRGSYHGRSFSTVAATGIRAWSPTSLSPLQVTYVHGGYKLRSPFRHLSDADYIDVCADELRTTIETSTSGSVACMILEPVQGAGGFATPPPGFFARMQSVLDEYGIPMISDEVQSGWGRTGASFFGYQSHGVRPAALAFAKGLAGGLPIGGVVAEASLMNCLEANSISTSGGNPLIMTAANATLDAIENRALQENADAMGRLIVTELRKIADETPFIAEIRGSGLMIGVEICHPGTIEPDRELTNAILEGCRAQGLLIGKGGLYGNVLRVTPPMMVTTADVSEAMTVLRDVIGTLACA